MSCSEKADCCENKETEKQDEGTKDTDEYKAFEEESLERWERASRLAKRAMDKMRGTIGHEVSADTKFAAWIKITKFFYQKLEWEDMGDKPAA